MNIDAHFPDFQRRFSELQEEHIRALKDGDVEAMERIQVQIAELMKRGGDRE